MCNILLNSISIHSGRALRRKTFECDDATDNVFEVTAYILEISAKKSVTVF
jgi:hypothetical protein